MKITQEIRASAGAGLEEQSAPGTAGPAAPDETIRRGLEDKAREFRELGGEIYVPSS